MAKRRKVFISFQHDDREKAAGFNLLRWNKNVQIDFVGRHLLSPVDSTNDQYIESKIKEMLHGTSVTVVLIGKRTCESKWVQWEIEQSLQKEHPNGILAIRLDDANLPTGCALEAVLNEAGAEIVDWDAHSFAPAIERAAMASGRAEAIILAGTGTEGESCSREAAVAD
jgi:hypothetical protein